MSFDNEFYYNILGVKQDDTLDNIYDNYRKRMSAAKSESLKYHISRAYTILSSDSSRKLYNDFLEQKGIIVDSAEFSEKYNNWLVSNFNDEALFLNIENGEKNITDTSPSVEKNEESSYDNRFKSTEEKEQYIIQKEADDVSEEELAQIKLYNETLSNEIDKLLSEPHNNYKLEIYKAKYYQQIKFLTAVLNIRSSRSTKNKLDVIKNKFEVSKISEELNNAIEKYNEIVKKVEEYNKRQRLGKINEKLTSKTEQLVQAVNSQPKISKLRIKRLEVQRSRLLEKRDKKGTRIKLKVIKHSKFYDKIVKATAFVKSIPSVFRKDELIDERVNSTLTLAQGVLDNNSIEQEEFENEEKGRHI